MQHLTKPPAYGMFAKHSQSLSRTSPDMSRTGRPFSPHLRADWKLSIEAALAAEVDLVLEDPVTRKPKYGARSKLVQMLLRNYLRAMQGQELEPLPTVQQLIADESLA
jgi:hypothetical protein